MAAFPLGGQLHLKLFLEITRMFLLYCSCHLASNMAANKLKRNALMRFAPVWRKEEEKEEAHARRPGASCHPLIVDVCAEGW